MAKNRPGSILYALGMTQHTTGVQGIRAFTILQLLLGNIGKPGGGVNALRGEPNVQGACDMGVLNNYLPGYLNYPTHTEPTLAAWTQNNGHARRRLLVNMLKAFYGDAATPENDFGYEWLPKKHAAKDYSSYRHLRERAGRDDEDAVDRRPEPGGELAQPAVVVRGARRSSTCWSCRSSGRPRRRRSGSGPASIRRRSRPRCCCCPPSFFMEKNGSITNSGAMVQWRYAAVKPPGSGEARRRDRRLRVPARARPRERLDASRRDEIIKKASWTYTNAEDVLREINGRALRDVPAANLKAGDLRQQDRRPAAPTDRRRRGCWIYAGVFSNGENLSKRRDSRTDPGGLGLYPNFGWTWPNNMRVLYNRASCDGTASPIPARSRSCGGTRARSAGPAMTCPTCRS